VNVHKIIRIAAVFFFAVGVGVAYHRLHRTPEQTALRQLVEDDLPKIRPSETAIYDRLDRLWRSPGLKPDEARTLLVDEVIPRLVRLRKQVEELPLPEAETRALIEEYLKATDQLIDACRTCVRIIDDPKLPTAVGMKQVRERFTSVEVAFRTWDRHVTEACARHSLAPPAGSR
jgi:hypothetical protein